MPRTSRKLPLALAGVFLLPVVAKALVWSFEPLRHWQDARWVSAGMLPPAADDPTARVTVFAARTAGLRGILAVHTWIAVKPQNADHYDRYEVTGWGRPLRVNALAADSLWIGSRPDIIGDVRGPLAASAIPKIESAIRDYPHADYGSYRLWPGPNSNTFVATVLRAAPELGIAMPPEAIGKDFRADGSFVGLTESETGIEASLFGILGLKIGWVEGIEVNFLGLVAGIDARHPALKIPAFGRIGLDSFTAFAATENTKKGSSP